MGFDMDVAEYSLLKTRFRSVDQALDFLGKGEEGIYNHKFIPSIHLTCYLCKEVK